MSDFDDEPREYASSPCYAHEFEERDARDALLILNTLQKLLRGERAGARIIRETLTEAKAAGISPEILKALRDVGDDEARYCRVMIEQINTAGATPDQTIGDFYEKCMAIESIPERLLLLNRGQAWVARKIREIQPLVRAGSLIEALEEMRDTHERNIERLAGLI